MMQRRTTNALRYYSAFHSIFKFAPVFFEAENHVFFGKPFDKI